MLSETHPLRSQVLDALNNINNVMGLRFSPLLEECNVLRRLVLPTNASADNCAIALATELGKIIDSLHPTGEEDLKQRNWLHYYLLHYAFRQDQSRQTVQSILGVGRSYFYELRNEAVDNVATILLSAPTSQELSFLEAIPATTDFVGRVQELAYYREQLVGQNLAIIHGFAGTGKTALAAQLATDQQEKGTTVLWVTFCRDINTNLASFLECLATVLEELGHPHLQCFLAESAQRPFPYPIDVRIRYAVNSLAQSSVMLCLDDLHLVEKDPQFQCFFNSLIPRQGGAVIPIVAISRNEPEFARGRHIRCLLGLSEADVGLLFKRADVDWLDALDRQQLLQRTDGNAAFLKYFIAWIEDKKIADLASAARKEILHEFINQLGQSLACYRFLLEEVISSMSLTQQQILEHMVLCRDLIGLAKFSAAILSPEHTPMELNQIVYGLDQQNLLVYGQNATQSRVHNLLKHYLLLQLEQSPQRLLQMHLSLGNYYKALGNVLEAAYHYGRCQQIRQTHHHHEIARIHEKNGRLSPNLPNNGKTHDVLFSRQKISV